ncbi:DUF5715 family protein [Granulicella pectinivorans]|nr:DUF5715 family protein [Granulicella pectinivorans]
MPLRDLPTTKMPNGPLHTLAVIAALSLLPASVAAKRLPQHVDQSHWVRAKHRVIEPVPVKSRHARPEPKPHDTLAKSKITKAHNRREAVERVKLDKHRRKSESRVEIAEKKKVIELPKAEPKRPDAPVIAVAEPLKLSAPVSVVSVVRENTEHPKLDPVGEVASTPQILPQLYDSGGRLNVLPAMRGSHDILVRQNVMADLDGLSRIQDDEDLARMREKRMLVQIPSNEGLRIDERLPDNRRYTRPWAAQFLLTLARAHYAQFHSPLQVNSAVRTVSFQLRLIRTNGNAAPAEGEDASPHLTGQAIDIAKKGLSQAEVAWMRLYLTPLQQDGKLDVEEEFQQACFHISVYRRYAPVSPGTTKIAVTHRSAVPASIAVDDEE